MLIFVILPFFIITLYFRFIYGTWAQIGNYYYSYCQTASLCNLELCCTTSPCCGTELQCTSDDCCDQVICCDTSQCYDSLMCDSYMRTIKFNSQLDTYTFPIFNDQQTTNIRKVVLDIYFENIWSSDGVQITFSSGYSELITFTSNPTQQFTLNFCTGTFYYEIKTFSFLLSSTSSQLEYLTLQITNPLTTAYIRNVHTAIHYNDNTQLICSPGQYYGKYNDTIGEGCFNQCYYPLLKPYYGNCVEISLQTMINNPNSKYWTIIYHPNQTPINNGIYTNYFGYNEGASITISNPSYTQPIILLQVFINGIAMPQYQGISIYLNQTYFASFYCDISCYNYDNLYLISTTTYTASHLMKIATNSFQSYGNFQVLIKSNLTVQWKIVSFTVVNSNCDQNCISCSKNYYCDQCKTNYLILNNGNCIDQTKCYFAYKNSTHCIQYDQVTPYSKYLIKQFIDFQVDDVFDQIFNLVSQQGINFLKGSAIYYSYDNYNKRIFGGQYVWAQAKFHQSYTISQPNHGVSIYFSVIFGPNFPTDGNFIYSLNFNSDVYLDPTSNLNIEYHETIQQTSIDINVECYGINNNVYDSFCGIKNYLIVVHYCNPFCSSCIDEYTCNIPIPTCNTNEFYDSYYLSCIQCPQECLSCFDQVNCNSCITNYVLLNNQCILQCTTNQYYDGSICQNCNQNCKGCNTQNTCNNCRQTNYRYLSNGQCICYKGYYDDGISNQCQECNKFCLDCYGPTQTECLECVVLQNFQLVISTCQCNEGYYYDDELQICNACHQTCKTCYYKTRNSCLSCEINLQRELIGQQCNCIIGYYELETKLCIPCPSIQNFNIQGCLHSCDNFLTYQWFSSPCTTCVNGYALTTYNECQPICGDSQIIGIESCDIISDRCLNCQIKCPQYCQQCALNSICANICGDGIIIDNEECDDLNTIEYDGCFNCKIDCQQECQFCVRGNCYQCQTYWQLDLTTLTCIERCQDGIIIGNEQCDYLNNIGCYNCRTISSSNYNMINQQCQIGYQQQIGQTYCYPVCGDGLIVQGEDCEDGNIINYDGCSSYCQWQCQSSDICKICFDNICYQCQYGYQLDISKNQCLLLTVCQDGNNQMFDGCYNNFLQCQSQCLLCSQNGCKKCDIGYFLNLSNNLCQNICGDSYISIDEECDDGNLIPFDGCHFCKYSCHPLCKNCIKGECQSIIYENYLLNNYKQDNNPNIEIQQFLFHCSNIIQNKCIYCDIGYYTNLNDYQCTSKCGDGILTEFEECDDANNIKEDGCYNCKYYCTDSCIICNKGICQSCINGYILKTGFSQCVQLPNCDEYPGFYLNLKTLTCDYICGDGIVSYYEQCDNGQSGITYMCKDCLTCDTDECLLIYEFICPSGYYFNSFTQDCETICGDYIVAGIEECDDNDELCFNCIYICDKFCLDCRSENQLANCYLCQVGYNLINNQCVEQGEEVDENYQCSLPGYEYVTETFQCVAICGDGIVAGTEDCDDGNSLNDDGCNTDCTISEDSICQNNECVSVIPPISTLSFIKETKGIQYVDIEFNQEMKLSSLQITQQNLLDSLQVSIVNDNSSISIKVSSLNSISQNLNLIQIQIEIIYSQFINKPELTVVFTNQSLLENQYNVNLQTKTISLILQDPNILDETSQFIANFLVQFCTYVTQILIAIMIISILIGHSEIATNLIDVIQLLYFFKYLNLQIGYNLTLFYNAFQSIQVQTFINIPFINDIMFKLFDFSFNDYQIPEQFNEDGRSGNFYINVQPILSAIGISLLTTFLLKKITFLLISQRDTFLNLRDSYIYQFILAQVIYFTNQIQALSYSEQLKDIIQALIYEIWLSSILSIQYSPINSFQSISSYILALILIYSVILYINCQITISMELNQNQSRQSFCYVYICFSRAVFILILTLLRDQKIYQLIFCIYNEFQQTVFTYKFHPYNSNYENKKQVFQHGILFLSSITQIGNIIFETDIIRLQLIGWIIISQYITIIFMNLIMDLRFLIGKYLKLRNKAKQKKLDKQNQSHTLFLQTK